MVRRARDVRVLFLRNYNTEEIWQILLKEVLLSSFL